MSYSDFKRLADIKKTFALNFEETEELFASVEKIKPSDILANTLKKTIPLALAIHTEKARSEFIVAPILLELYTLLNGQISLFSGVDFDVEPDKGLNGTCDFLISRSREQLIISAPVISLVEAKNDNLKAGLPQCIAEMIASQLFNERENNQIQSIYGVVTTGELWQFLKLQGELVSFGLKIYHLQELETILGILVRMVKCD